MVNRTRIEGGGYSKHDIITWYDQQAGCNIIVDVLFERSEFLIDTWYIPKTKSVRVCPCASCTCARVQ